MLATGFRKSLDISMAHLFHTNQTTGRLQNYKHWAALLWIAFVNFYHLFVNIDMGWQKAWT